MASSTSIPDKTIPKTTWNPSKASILPRVTPNSGPLVSCFLESSPFLGGESEMRVGKEEGERRNVVHMTGKSLISEGRGRSFNGTALDCTRINKTSLHMTLHQSRPQSSCETNRQTDRPTDRPTDSQIYRQTE